MHLSPEREANGWSGPAEDGYFYCTGLLNENQLTARLLDGIELNANAYALTESNVFRLDVLADAIQISDKAANERGRSPS